MPNAAVAEISLQLGIRGPSLTYACACASSAVAIGEALRALRGGWIDVAVVGGHESMLSPGVLASWQAMRVLAPTGPEGRLAASACRPFPPTGRAPWAKARPPWCWKARPMPRRAARGALCVSGYATNSDARHISQPDAAGQVRAMQAALRDAGLQPPTSAT
jgi:3-oxoacyl-[acyl-carrier-protein] synthase II